jgi:replicative DNA helicase
VTRTEIARRPEPSATPGEALPAHNLEAERSLLGAALLRPSLIPSIDLEPEQFYRLGHQRIWAVMLALTAAGQTVDTVTIKDALAKLGHLEDAGGPAGIAALVDGVPLSTNIEAYARIVAEKATLRILTDEIRLLKARLEIEADDPEVLLQEAEATVTTLQNRVQRSRAFDAMAQLEAWSESVEREESGPRIGLGLPAIDQVLGGVKPGEVLGIMARPGIGKTVLLCHITSHMTGLGHQLFSLEMPLPQIVERLARMAYNEHKRVLRYRLTSGTFDGAVYLQTYADLFLDASPMLSVAQMAARVRRTQAQRTVAVVSVDHLGLIGGDDKLSTYDRVSKQVRELKEMAKRLNVAIVLLIQVNREAGGDGSRELHLGSARDSGVVEEAVDYLITLRRLDRASALTEAERTRYKDILFAKVLKHRHESPMIDEVGYRIDFKSLQLIEVPDLKPEQDDLARLAKMGGRR